MSRTRVLVAGLGLSAAAFVGLVLHEGYSERAYPDPTHGTTGPVGVEHQRWMTPEKLLLAALGEKKG